MAQGVAAITLLLGAPPAWANGRYPAGNQMVFDPGDARHLIVSTTFGLLESRDAAKTFDWTCDAALALVDQQDGMLAITPTGTTVVATFTGVRTSDDGCTYRSAPDLAHRIVPDLALSRSAPYELLAFRTIGAADGGYDSQIVRSDDDGLTWQALGAPLPAELLPLTIDIAPSDSQRVYLSGRLGKDDGYQSALLRSVDGGLTFATANVPETSGFRDAYIAAVDPLDADRLYVRINDPAGTVLTMTEDGGATWRDLFAATGQLLGFAISPDGAHIAFGGPEDGLWTGSADGIDLHRQADVGPTCLRFGAGALYVCADAQKTGFSLARSYDLGATFEPLLRFDALCGSTTCGGATTVAQLCPNDWQNVAPVIGATCGLDAGSPADAAMDAGPSDLRASGGCQMSSPSAPRFPWLALLASCRRRRRPSASTSAGRWRSLSQPQVSKPPRKGPTIGSNPRG